MTGPRVVHANRERELRLQRYGAEAQHIIELVKPRFAAFTERFKPVVKVEPAVRQTTRAVNLTFAATVANVPLRFEVGSTFTLERSDLGVQP